MEHFTFDSDSLNKQIFRTGIRRGGGGGCGGR